MRIALRRLQHTDDGTFGVFILPTGVFCYSLELPWRDNKPNRSCIPLGEYLCVPRISPRFGRCYHVTGVEDRTWILTHAANLAGDVEMGKKTHLEGCIAPGQKIGWMLGQKCILSSRSALTRLLRALDFKPFTLVVEDESCGN